MSKKLFYRMFCKKCKQYRAYELAEDDMIGGLEFDTMNHLFLNCHRCNDYSIFVSMAKNKIFDRMREGYGKLDGKPPRFTFEWR